MHVENLRKLAAHLRSGNLFQSKFDFAVFRCGTVGCAIGECADLFNDLKLDALLKEFSDTQSAVTRTSSLGIVEWAKAKFEIDYRTFLYLFSPCSSIVAHHAWLTTSATPEQVAALIEDFLKTGEYHVRSYAEITAIKRGDLDMVSNDIPAYCPTPAQG